MPGPVLLDLPGKSRRIRVEPLRSPVPPAPREPEPAREPPPAEREPERREEPAPA